MPTHPGAPADWRDSASCAQSDPELFYADSAAAKAAAKAVCARCPVRDTCLAVALVTGERFGVWGGLDADERARLARPPRAA